MPNLLFHRGEAWVKRNSNDLFDVLMVSFHGVALCELIVLYILYNLKDMFKISQYGLYRGYTGPTLAFWG